MKIFKDFLGNTVKIGDYIFYSTTSRYAESRLCKVTRFTEKSMFAFIIKRNRVSYSKGKEVLVKNDFIIIADYKE